MATRIIPGNGKDWDTVLGIDETIDEDKSNTINSALLTVAGYLRHKMMENHGRPVAIGNAKQAFGNIIWNLLEVSPDADTFFIATVKKIIEANPRVYREVNNV